MMVAINNAHRGVSGASTSIITGSTDGPISIPGSDFFTLEKPRLQSNILLFGDGGCGKSTFALRYAPEPVAFINFDRRADIAVQRALADGRRIHMMRVELSAHVMKLDDAAVKRINQAAVDRVIKNFEVAVEQSLKGNIRTICLDTGTEYGELLTLAVRGRIDRAARDYGESKNLINREWWRLYNLAREGHAHFVVLSRAKAIWKNNEPTGAFTFRGHDVMNDAADWAAQIRLGKAPSGKSQRRFELEITKGGINIAQLGEVYTEKEWKDLGGPFVFACIMQYEGTGVEDWS